MQTTLIPAGGAAIVEFHTEVPGSYVLVDHSIFRAFNKGALAILKVDGPENKLDLFRQGSGLGLSGRRAGPNLKAVSAATKAARAGNADTRGSDQGRRSAVQRHLLGLSSGQRRGTAKCLSAAGEIGLLAADPKRAIAIVLHGLTGKVTVNGNDYNSVMPPMTQLNDDEVANILTYVLNSWGNPGGRITRAGRREGARAAGAAAATPAH